jgi:hypothetical protein
LESDSEPGSDRIGKWIRIGSEEEEVRVQFAMFEGGIMLVISVSGFAMLDSC